MLFSAVSEPQRFKRCAEQPQASSRRISVPSIAEDAIAHASCCISRSYCSSDFTHGNAFTSNSCCLNFFAGISQLADAEEHDEDGEVFFGGLLWCDTQQLRRRSSVLKLRYSPIANVVRCQLAVSGGCQMTQHAINFALQRFVAKFTYSLPPFQMRLSFGMLLNTLQSANTRQKKKQVKKGSKVYKHTKKAYKRTKKKG